MKRLLIYDASANAAKTFVGKAWKTWAGAMASRFDDTLAVTSWADCMEKLKALQAAGKKYDACQFWGHGWGGQIYIDKYKTTSSAGEPGTPDSFWEQLGLLMKPTGVVWLRICSFASGATGKAACDLVSQQLGCRLLAHTHIIGDLASQSGCRATHWPDMKASWPDSEGRKGGVDGAKKSAPWLPNTVSALQISEPSWPTNK